MKWQEKLAVLKVAGYKFNETPEWKAEPDEFYRWWSERGVPNTDGYYYEADDDLQHLVHDAWDNYEWEVLNDGKWGESE